MSLIVNPEVGNNGIKLLGINYYLSFNPLLHKFFHFIRAQISLSPWMDSQFLTNDHEMHLYPFTYFFKNSIWSFFFKTFNSLT